MKSSEAMLFSRRLMRDYPQLADLEIADLGDHLYLNKLVVKPEFRGQGVGKQIVRCVQDYARKRGLKLALVPHPLDKGTEQGKLNRFYRGLGFKGTHGNLSFHNPSNTLVSEDVRQLLNL